eukprot:scaffold166451_cov39-Tisochrysis_lutea.AAC.1
MWDNNRPNKIHRTISDGRRVERVWGRDTGHALLHTWVRKDVVDARAASRIHDEQPVNHILEVTRVASGDWVVLAAHDLAGKSLHRLGLKRWPESAQFVEHATE